MGVLIHVAGDAANNVGVIIAGAVIWKISSPDRYYADPAVSMAIAFMIFFSSIPLGLSNPFHLRLTTGDVADPGYQSGKAVSSCWGAPRLA